MSAEMVPGLDVNVSEPQRGERRSGFAMVDLLKTNFKTVEIDSKNQTGGCYLQPHLAAHGNGTAIMAGANQKT